MYDRVTGIRFPAGTRTYHRLVWTEFRAQQFPFSVDLGGEFFAQEHGRRGLEGDSFTPITPLPRSGMRAYFHNPHVPLCRVDTQTATSYSNLVSCKSINLGNGGSSL